MGWWDAILPTVSTGAQAGMDSLNGVANALAPVKNMGGAGAAAGTAMYPWLSAVAGGAGTLGAMLRGEKPHGGWAGMLQKMAPEQYQQAVAQRQGNKSSGGWAGMLQKTALEAPALLTGAQRGTPSMMPWGMGRPTMPTGPTPQTYPYQNPMQQMAQPSGPPPGMGGSSYGGEMVMIQSPTGETQAVPAAHAEHFIQRGGRRVG